MTNELKEVRECLEAISEAHGDRMTCHEVLVMATCDTAIRKLDAAIAEISKGEELL